MDCRAWIRRSRPRPLSSHGISHVSVGGLNNLCVSPFGPKPNPWRRRKLKFKIYISAIYYRDHFVLDPTTSAYHRSALKSSLEEEETIVISWVTPWSILCWAHLITVRVLHKPSGGREITNLHIISSHELNRFVFFLVLDPTTCAYHRSVLKSSLEEEETIIISWP